MPQFIKATLAALLVSAAPLAVQAAELTIDFESLPTGAISPSAYPSQGVSFPSSLAFVQNHLTPTASLGNKYVRTLGSLGAFLEMDVLNPAITDFNILSFDYLGALRLSVQGVKGVSPDVLFDSPAITGWKTFSMPALDLDVYGLITAITFSPNFQSLDGAQGFGIDNMRLSVQGGTVLPPVGTVPEPATFGLLAVALLGVGLATRRRRV